MEEEAAAGGSEIVPFACGGSDEGVVLQPELPVQSARRRKGQEEHSCNDCVDEAAGQSVQGTVLVQVTAGCQPHSLGCVRLNQLPELSFNSASIP